MVAMLAHRLILAQVALSMLASQVFAGGPACCQPSAAEHQPATCCCARRAAAASCCAKDAKDTPTVDKDEKPCCAKRRAAQAKLAELATSRPMRAPCCCKARRPLPAVPVQPSQNDEVASEFFAAPLLLTSVVAMADCGAVSPVWSPHKTSGGQSLNALLCRWTI